MKKGLTLIEILVAVSLSVILITSLYAVYLTSYKSYKRSTIKAELNQNARISLERISRDLRQTDRITTQLPADENDPYNPPPAEIQFADGHNTEKIQYIKYLLLENNLRQQTIHYSFSSDPAAWVAWNAQDQDGNPPQETIDEDIIKAENITSLKFFGEKLITTEIIVSDGSSSYTYKTKTLGRNVQ